MVFDLVGQDFPRFTEIQSKPAKLKIKNNEPKLLFFFFLLQLIYTKEMKALHSYLFLIVFLQEGQAYL